MFDIGWSELVVIAVVALIAIGPKELPAVLRTVGQYLGKIRRMASEFQGQFQEAMREAEMADMKKEFDEISEAASDLTNFDPMQDMQKELDAAITDKPPESPATETGAPPAAAEDASPGTAPDTPAVSADDSARQPGADDTAPKADAAAAPEALASKAGSGA